MKDKGCKRCARVVNPGITKKLSAVLLSLLAACFIFLGVFEIEVSAGQHKAARASAPVGKMNDDLYVKILSRMISYDHLYQKKYKIINPEPYANRTAEGVTNIYKYQTAMKQQRKAILEKYGVSAEQFGNFSSRLSDGASTPEGSKHRQKLLDRAVYEAKKL